MDGLEAIQRVDITLAEPDERASEWLDYFDYRRQLEAAGMRLWKLTVGGAIGT
ncbi:MAG: hypothetical protein ABI629_04900 [bacterium]